MSDTLAGLAQAMYAAHDRVQAARRGTDEHTDARMAYAEAREAYDAHMAARAMTYGARIRKA